MGTGGRNLKKEEIFDMVEYINNCFQAYDFNTGNGKNVPVIVNNNGTLELKGFKKDYIINFTEKQKYK